jgi:hypothetical protein
MQGATGSNWRPLAAVVSTSGCGSSCWQQMAQCARRANIGCSIQAFRRWEPMSRLNVVMLRNADGRQKKMGQSLDGQKHSAAHIKVQVRQYASSCHPGNDGSITGRKIRSRGNTGILPAECNAKIRHVNKYVEGATRITIWEKAKNSPHAVNKLEQTLCRMYCSICQ